MEPGKYVWKIGSKHITISHFLVLLMITGGILRFYNLNWDLGMNFHPDERNIDAAVSRISFSGNLNPEFFAYGSFTIYLYRITGEIIAFITNSNSWILSWGKINLISRSFSALFSVLTIPAIYKLANRIFNKKIAILTSFLVTFSTSLVQTSHFGVTESLITLLGVLICISSIKFLEKPSPKNIMTTGLLLGVSISTKISSLFFFIFPLVALLLLTFKKPLKIRSFINSASYLIFLFAYALFIFLLISPYTVLSWNKFMESMRYETGVARGTLPVPYTYQFTNTYPYLFQLKNLLWQMGPVVILSIAGYVLITRKILRERPPALIILISFPTIYFSYLGMWHTKFIRYMVPILPYLAMFASYLLVTAKEKRFFLSSALMVLTVSVTVFWCLAFFSIYTKEQTRVTASKWIFENIPENSVIYTEHWDDGLPVQLPEYESKRRKYQLEQLEIYEPDNADKLDYYSNNLSEGDYIVINSRRLYGTLINLTEKYPITSRYYKLLFEGKLGYKQIAVFASFPSLFFIEIDDTNSEETFQVYDHPKVIIFKNIDRLRKGKIRNIIENEPV